MEEVYAGIDIVALTSLNEGTPVSLIEAQASNKPIVATNVGGVKDVCIENDTALICESEDSNAFSTQLLKLIEHDDVRFNMGLNGKKFVEKKYDKSRLVSDMRTLYYQLLKEKNVQF
jgi:glycosyltransferase involved in cell wall biosynthesis